MNTAMQALIDQMAAEFKDRLASIVQEAMVNPSSVVLPSERAIKNAPNEGALMQMSTERNEIPSGSRGDANVDIRASIVPELNAQIVSESSGEFVSQRVVVNHEMPQENMGRAYGAQNVGAMSGNNGVFAQEQIIDGRYGQRNWESPYAPALQANSYFKLIELPTLSGDPLDWPMFERSYIDTSTEFGFSDARNIIRLRQALKGEARIVVESMLPFPNSVKEIMQTLKENFGRPEQLVNRQMANVRKIPILGSGDFRGIVAFSNALKNMTAQIKYANAEYRLCDTTLLSELVSKLPCHEQMMWAEYKERLSGYANIQHLSEFLSVQAKRANAVRDSLPKEAFRETSKAPPQRASQNKHALVAQVEQRPCVVCGQTCSSVATCTTFEQLSVDERWNRAKACKLCFSCLKQGHAVDRCYQKKKCSIENCNKRHNKLLHKGNEPCTKTKQDVVYCAKVQSNENTVWFQMVPVEVRSNDKRIVTFAFMDPGSSHSMIEWSLAEQLGVSGQKETLSMHWLSGVRSENSTERVSFDICGIMPNCSPVKMSRVYTVRGLNLPIQSLNFNGTVGMGKFKKHVNVQYENAQPQIIIGLDNAKLITPLDKPAPINNQGAMAMRTRLGWVIYGPHEYGSNKTSTFVGLSVKERLNNLEVTMKHYFEDEDIGVQHRKQDGMSAENRQLLHKMQETSKFVNGRWEVQLLWKNESVQLPNNYEMALMRFKNVQRKMKQNADFAEKYKQKIESYLANGYARKLSPEEAEQTSRKTYYLPHFAIVNPNKSGIRVVFDAAAEVNGCSLNKNLLAGPDLNQSLISILFKFRTSPVAVVADIKEMFLQIAVCQEDQDALRFLWEDNDGISQYVMTRLIFGAACSPTLAQFAKNANALRYNERWPQAAAAVMYKHYVDDYVDCFDNVSQAIDVVQKVVAIHHDGGFELRNFASNSEEFLRSLNGSEASPQIVQMDNNDMERVLGMYWECSNDQFSFVLKCHKVRADILAGRIVPTKREILSIIMSVFDPFGLVANFMIMGKLIMQSLWKTNLHWDESIPPQLFEKWKIWLSTLKLLKEVKVPRCYSKNLAQAECIQLHVFADASEEAVAAVAYLRIAHGREVQVSFVFAKSRCAPLRYTSIPRLELQAALIAVRLKDTILENLAFKVHEVIFWTDSKTVYIGSNLTRAFTSSMSQIVLVRY